MKYIMIGVAVIAATLYYFLFDPVETKFMPQCLFHRLTGLQCVGCGTQRMIHALLHGQFAEAFMANMLAFLSIPFIAFFLWVDSRRIKCPKLYVGIYSTRMIIGVVIVLIAWFIIRNILDI